MGIDISKVTTKGGDHGQTSLSCGTRVPKDHPRVLFMGQLDSLNCLLGTLRTYLDESSKSNQEILKHPHVLIQIQNDIFDLGAYYSFEQKSSYQSQFGPERTLQLEMWMADWIPTLPPLKSFVLPGGHIANALAHQIRSRSREIESWAISHKESLQLQDPTLAYLNRTSDFFFVYSRIISQVFDVPEYLWQNGLNQST